MLTIRQVSGGYDHHTPVIRQVDFCVEKGEFFGILGPNGSGKTTLLKMISGLLPYSHGDIRLEDKTIGSYSQRELAKKLAVVPQLTPQAFSFTVRETIALGRYAHHRGLFQAWTKEDAAIVQAVMEQTNTAVLAEASLNELSGGQQQRVYLAQALAQQLDILLLDEPTNHLDLANQKHLLDLLKQSAQKQGLTVVSIFHDVNLASLYCDRLLLLKDGQTKTLDSPAHVLTEPMIQEVYQTVVKDHPHPKVAKPQMHLLPESDQHEGSESIIDDKLLNVTEAHISLESPIPLKTLSSGVCGAGIGWHTSFINRKVDKNYTESDHLEDMQDYLSSVQMRKGETVGMMTAVHPEDAKWRFVELADFSLLVVVTAGVGNATDSAQAISQHVSEPGPGTINMWLFINGELTDEAYIQAIMTATEAKTQALQMLNVKDKMTGTPATGTSTDSILVAATQQGMSLPYAGTATKLGGIIGKTVYDVTTKAIRTSSSRADT